MIIIVGTLLGFLTGLGVGGGSLLVIWLTAVLGMEQAAARGINLLFFLPGAAIAILCRRKQGSIRWRNVLPPAIAGCIAAAVFSYFSTVWDTEILKKIFGGILIAAGSRELFWKSKQKMSS